MQADARILHAAVVPGLFSDQSFSAAFLKSGLKRQTRPKGLTPNLESITLKEDRWLSFTQDENQRSGVASTRRLLTLAASSLEDVPRRHFRKPQDDPGIAENRVWPISVGGLLQVREVFAGHLYVHLNGALAMWLHPSLSAPSDVSATLLMVSFVPSHRGGASAIADFKFDRDP